MQPFVGHITGFRLYPVGNLDIGKMKTEVGKTQCLTNRFLYVIK